MHGGGFGFALVLLFALNWVFVVVDYAGVCLLAALI